MFTGVVSKNKRRYRDAGFDLDLAYIHDRIIAMGAPCEGREALYRNPMDQVQRFLARRHGTRCRVYNLCAERAYDCTRLGAQVVRYPLEDHQVGWGISCGEKKHVHTCRLCWGASWTQSTPCTQSTQSTHYTHAHVLLLSTLLLPKSTRLSSATLPSTTHTGSTPAHHASILH